MAIAKQKGYTEFAAPAIAHDTCWLDFFLKACQYIYGCKSTISYLTLHRYRADCDTYVATPENQGWREDLGYVMTFNRLRNKYNGRGFHIKGLLLSEFGCFNRGWAGFAPAHAQEVFMNAWLRDTVIKVLHGDQATKSLIEDSPLSRWIGANGPDADTAPHYQPNTCRWQDPGHGSRTGAEAVQALQSISSVAWFSIHPGRNYLFEGHRLNHLGNQYFDACNSVGGGGVALPSGCHTAVAPEECYSHVKWAKHHGVHGHPDWYPGLSAQSSFEDFQLHFHHSKYGKCPRPCPAR